MKKTLLIIIAITITLSILVSCNNKDLDNKKQSIEKYWETLDSTGFSVYLGNAIKEQQTFENFITADLESDVVACAAGVDAADDPAIWINTENPEKSLILGTNKKGGIHVYDMNGKELQYLKIGCLNNIDLRDNFEFNGENVVLVAASNCGLNSISLFFIDKTTLLLSDTILNIKSKVDLVYGLCMYKSAVTGKYYVFVNGERADVEQWEVYQKDQELKADLVRSFKVSSRPEGMVADDEDAVLYIGVEEEGILKVKAEPENEFETNWVNGSQAYTNDISSDIEGLALYKTPEKTILIASSQGNFSYVLIEIGDEDKYLTSFIIKDGDIDGVEETDGLDVINYYISEEFPKGMMVVQDGFNFENDSIRAQNFKFISLEKIENIVKNFTK